MIKFPIALQLYSIRDDLEKDFEGALQKVKDLGYDGVEFAGLYGRTPEEIKTLLKKIGLTALSAHVPFADLMDAPEKTLQDYADIGCEYVAIPYLMPEYRPGSEKFSEVIEGAKMLGKIANRLHLTLLYHNHDFEFQKLDGKYALDILYTEVGADLLQTELDTCWVNIGGENPADYIRKYSGRTPVVHLKDFYMPGKKPDKMYELIGVTDDQKAEEGPAFEFRPVGSGMQNFPAILAAAEESGAKWVVVEQDMPSMGKSPMECAASSIQYLQAL